MVVSQGRQGEKIRIPTTALLYSVVGIRSHDAYSYTMSSDGRKIATTKHPSMEAVLNGLLRLPDMESAQGWMQKLRNHFIASQKLAASPEELVIWVKGYGLTDAQKAEGYLGHFVRIVPQQKKNYVTLTATLLPMDVKSHPQREYPKHKDNPNWGHPLLRKLKKGASYPTIEEAQSVLAKLHQQFPNVSIPGLNKLFLMIYSREGGGKPMKKYIFEITTTPEHQFAITHKLNVKPEKPVIHSTPPSMREEGAENKPTARRTVGKFTAQVALKKKRKPASSGQS